MLEYEKQAVPSTSSECAASSSQLMDSLSDEMTQHFEVSSDIIEPTTKDATTQWECPISVRSISTQTNKLSTKMKKRSIGNILTLV